MPIYSMMKIKKRRKHRLRSACKEMTQREHDIYKIIKEEPLISQNEIAARLGITRSAVSSYLATMQKKGIIKGRGYIVNTGEYPLLVGPGHIDIVSICSKSSHRPGLYESNKTTISYGGAIKNIAHYLARLDIHPHAIFTASSDFFGTQFLMDCTKNGIDASDSLILNDTSMPIYNEINYDEEEVIAAATMSDNLAGRLTPDFLKTKERTFRGAAQIILHDTLSHEAIDYITSAFNDSALVYFSTYYHDTVKHLDLINRFHYMILSFATAQQLSFPDETPSKVFSEETLLKICQGLRLLGIKNAVILCSLQTTCFLQKKNIYIQTTQTPATHNRQTYRYYRDASAASIVHSLLNCHEPEMFLNHLAATKLIAASSASFIDSNYCTALVEQSIQKLDSIVYTIPESYTN